MTTTTMNKSTNKIESKAATIESKAATTESKGVKRKSPGPHFKSPLVNVYKNNHVHQDVLSKMASLYPVKMQEGYNIMMTFNGHSDMPVYVSQKDLVALYNIKMTESTDDMSKEAKCDKMVSMVVDHIKNKYKTCIKQKSEKKVKMTTKEKVVENTGNAVEGVEEDVLNMDDLFSSDEE
jgi:hypothetical protein